MAKGFEYVAEYEIPGLGTYKISHGPFMLEDDPKIFGCWKNGSGIGLKSSTFAGAKQLLHLRIKKDLQLTIDKVLNSLIEIGCVLAVAKPATTGLWLSNYIIKGIDK